MEPKALVEHYLNTINKTKIQMKKLRNVIQADRTNLAKTQIRDIFGFLAKKTGNLFEKL